MKELHSTQEKEERINEFAEIREDRRREGMIQHYKKRRKGGMTLWRGERK